MQKLLFHLRCGKNAQVTESQNTALRPEANYDYSDGVVLTSRILRDGEHFEVKIDEMVDCWTGSLQIGATTQDPNTFQFPSTMTDLASGAWMLTADGVHHDGKIIGDEELGEAMDELKASVGDTVGVTWKKDGTIHFTINGVDNGVSATDVPAGVYGVVDIFAQTSQVTIVDH
ncbi:hypothetical protein NP493_518g02013 [Ridgeia piscesae]|uniref:NHR domain-containing protein n=1 Tax=Ridgeia piscesae TaxID=27915 RepID=A0AAD9NTP2_RIDPI|nr:hypothetical protein NP493_518g02013 [Ridgeia piscesae]